MADGDSPVVQRRQLAKELRKLRSADGKTVKQVADALECSSGKISRIETAEVGVRPGDLRDLLDLYEVHGDARERLMELLRQSRRRTSWWHEFAGALPSSAMRFFGLEDGAATIDEYSGGLIPGLLQTDGYMRALIGTAKNTATGSTDPVAVAELRARIRIERQRLLDRDDPPAVRIVLAESVLAARFGGAAAMITQLAHLRAVATRPNVTIRVMPLSSAAFAAAGGSFVVFTFPDPEANPPIVYQETRTESLYREAPKEVALYAADFDEVLDMAMDPSETLEIIEHWQEIHRVSSQRAG